MTGRTSPTVRRRRLARALRQYREAAGMSSGRAARALKDLGGSWAQSKVSRIETAQTVRLSVRDVRDMLDVYGVTDEEEREAVLALARQAREQGWWTAYRDLLPDAYLGFEAEASSMRNYEPLLVPGLFQTERYAYAIFKAARPKATQDELERRVAARMTRRILFERDDPLKLWAIVDEIALRRPIGGWATLRAQLDRLIEVAQKPSVTLQVLPLDIGAHPGLGGPFVILAFPDESDPPLIYIETGGDSYFLEGPEHVERYGERFDRLRADALGPEASLKYAATIRRELDDPGKPGSPRRRMAH